MVVMRSGRWSARIIFVCAAAAVWLSSSRSILALHDVTCRTVPGLTKDQLELCYRAPDVSAAAIEGMELAVRECQFQFQNHRWNCSLSAKKRNPHASNLFKRGFRESAFLAAISAAGVVHSVAKACSSGRLMSCGCDPSTNRKTLTRAFRESLQKQNRLFLDTLDNNIVQDDASAQKKMRKKKTVSRWKWGGCSHNMEFGVQFSEMFLDSREKASDIQSQINLHNNRVGRLAVVNNMQVRCKCHGMSGSCQLKTCWRSAPDFRVVGKFLKQQFRRAVLVDQSNLGNGPPVVVVKKTNKKRQSKFRNNKNRRNNRPNRRSTELGASRVGGDHGKQLETSLFYYQRSPTFCDRDSQNDILGTSGRKCNRTGGANNSCKNLCCGRGYSLVREQRIEKCQCKFNWCCYVECQECLLEEWNAFCN